MSNLSFGGQREDWSEFASYETLPGGAGAVPGVAGQAAIQTHMTNTRNTPIEELEILKQLYLKPRLLILDEPTSVLTPQEADEVLAYVRAVAKRGECTVLMITHKFREVMAYADEVTVLRRGKRVHGATVKGTTPEQLAQAMIGDSAASASARLSA